MPWQPTHYGKYDNPYASPPPMYDSSVCDNCNGPTGREGGQGWKAICSNCAEATLYFYTAYQEEDYDDQLN